MTDGPEAGLCKWRAGILDPANESALAEAACKVADLSMRWRCRGALNSYDLWRDSVTSSVKLDDRSRKSVIPFLRTVFGLPNLPPHIAHLCGWIAEFIWFELTNELTDEAGRKLRHVEGPGFHATEPGGDGLAVWRRQSDDKLTFCLWEVKNHVGESALTATISGAYKQLGERATEYLAKLTSVSAAKDDDVEVRNFYAGLVDMWVEDSDQSGAGIAIGTHSRLMPKKSFSSMHKYFPGKNNPWQLEGLIAGIADFQAFSADVRERVWIAL